MSDVYRCELVLPSTVNNRIAVDLAKAERRLMDGEPWIVREYGYGTTDSGDWHDTPAAAWEAAAEQLQRVAVKYREQIDRCLIEAAKARQAVTT